MRSRLLIALLLAAALPAGAEERPAPPPPDVRGPSLPLARPPATEPPQAAEPRAEPPVAPAPVPLLGPLAPREPPADAHPAAAPTDGHAAPPAAGKPTLEDHAATATPGLAGDATKSAGSDAAAAAAAIRGLAKKSEPAGAARDLPVPPSLTGRALAEELRRSAGGRASEKEALAAERARLEKLSKEIGEARAALKTETDRLAALVKAAADAPAPKAAAKPGAKPTAPPLENLARTVKSMKPDQAAALLGRVDRSLAAALLQRMKPAESAAVLDRMDGAASAALVALIARKESP